MPAALVAPLVAKPSAASSLVSRPAAPSTPDALATFTIAPSVTSGRVVVVGGSVVDVVVDVEVDEEVLELVDVGLAAVAVVLTCVSRLLLQPSGTSTNALTAAQRTRNRRRSVVGSRMITTACPVGVPGSSRVPSCGR